MDTEELIVDKKEVGMKWNIDIWDTDQDVLLAKRSKAALITATIECLDWLKVYRKLILANPQSLKGIFEPPPVTS